MIVYAVNSYVTELLKKNLEWDKVHGLTPMVPAQQVPELMNGGKPFIAYMFSEEYNSGDLGVMASVVITYAIYDVSAGGVNDAAQLIFDAFKHHNSANNINTWIRKATNGLDSKDKTDSVASTESMNLDGAGPVESEGGRHASIVQVRVRYINHSTSTFAV